MDWIRRNINLILAAAALAGFLLHIHDDYKRMQFTQTQHENAIKEIQQNLTRTWKMIADEHREK